MHTATYGITGLGQTRSLSAVTQELSALVGVSGLTVKVEPNGISLLTLTGQSQLDEADIAAVIEPLGCSVVHLAVAS